MPGLMASPRLDKSFTSLSEGRKSSSQRQFFVRREPLRAHGTALSPGACPADASQIDAPATAEADAFTAQ